ncbi:MAG: hypothetical protein ACW99U_21740 [Candidatus Thorarchaeota archaeon]|jgi:hypothetical protein
MIKTYQVNVYAPDRKTILTTVSNRVTSIGASKAAGVNACMKDYADGKPYQWIAKQWPIKRQS